MTPGITWAWSGVDLAESTCGRFTIVRSDYPTRRYLAWQRPTEPRQMATLLGGFDRAEDARAACERA